MKRRSLIRGGLTSLLVVIGFLLCCSVPAHAAGVNTVPVYRFYFNAWQSHMYRTVPDLPGPGWQSEGIAFYVSPVQVPDTVPLYAVYKKSSGSHYFGDHFYTIDLAGRNYCVTSLGYVDEGVLGYVLPKDKELFDSVPLYRWVRVHKDSYDQVLQDHFYQTSNTSPANYGSEGIECRVWTNSRALPDPSQGLTAVPVYRFYFDAWQVHMYRTTPDLPGAGWQSEGIAFYLSPVQLPYTVPLYEVYKPSIGDHFYTVDYAGRNYCIASLGYEDHGVLGYVMAKDRTVLDTTPLNRWVRVHKDSYDRTWQDHFYQTGTTVPANYGSEGVECRVWTKAISLPPKLVTIPMRRQP